MTAEMRDPAVAPSSRIPESGGSGSTEAVTDESRIAAGGLGRRVGRWQYDRGCGWRLDGTTLVIDRERHGEWSNEHGYVAQTGKRAHWPVARYLTDAMREVEDHLAEYDQSTAKAPS